MSYFQDFPNTNFYNQDLGWLIRKYKELNGNIKILQEIYDMIKDQIKDITIEQLQEWLDDGKFDEILKNLVTSVFVENYGAKGDGVTDSTSAIQNAINENPNCKIRFKGGTYLISKPIKITNFAGIDFDLGGSVLTTNTNIDSLLIVGENNGVNSSDIIQNGCLDCNNVAKVGILLKGYLNFFSNLTILDPVNYGIEDDGLSNSPQKIFNNIYICKKDTSSQFSENLQSVGMKLNHDNILNNIHIGRFYKAMILEGDYNLINNIHLWTQYKTNDVDVGIFNQSVAIQFSRQLSINNFYLDNFKIGCESLIGGSCNIDNLQILQIGVTSGVTNTYVIKNVNNGYRLNITTLTTVQNLKILPELNTGYIQYSHCYGEVLLTIPSYNEPFQVFDIHDVVANNVPRFCINGTFDVGSKWKIGELKIPQGSSHVAVKLKISNRQYGYHEVLVDCDGNLSGVGTVNRLAKIANPSPNNDYGIGVFARNETLEDVTYNVFDIYVYMIVQGTINITVTIEKLTPVLCLLKDTREAAIQYTNTAIEVPMSY